MAERIAVVDLGSNSFRLVVFTRRRRLVEAHRRDLRGRAHRRGPGRDRRARREPGWRARWRRWRSSRTSARPAASSPTTSSRSRPARSATPRTPRQFLERAAGGQRPARARAQRARRRRATATWPRSTRRRWPTASMLDIGGGSMQLVHVAGRHARELDSWRAGRRAHDRALPARRRPGQAQAARASCAGTSQAKLERAPWLAGARARGWSASAARSATSPPRPSATVERARVRRPGLRASRARRSTAWSSELAAHAGRARQGPRHQARARRHHPRRRGRRADGDGGRRLRRASRSPRPACARACSSSDLPRRRPAAVRRRAPRERASTSPRSTTWPDHDPHVAHVAAARARALRRAGRRRRCTPATRSSASCCGRRRCCTTSA